VLEKFFYDYFKKKPIKSTKIEFGE